MTDRKVTADWQLTVHTTHRASGLGWDSSAFRNQWCPIIGPTALVALQFAATHKPSHPWTVGELARQCGVQANRLDRTLIRAARHGVIRRYERQPHDGTARLVLDLWAPPVPRNLWPQLPVLLQQQLEHAS